jgi:hypothetical protein
MGMAKGIGHLLRLNHFWRFLHKYCSICVGPSSCPGPQSGIQNKDGGFPDDRGYGMLLWWKFHHPTNITKIICTVHALSLHPYWGSAKKRLYKTFKAFINTSRCERHLFFKWETRVYNATPWKVLKCKTLGVAIPGSRFHHPLCPATLPHPSDEQQVGWCNAWMLTTSFSSC